MKVRDITSSSPIQGGDIWSGLTKFWGPMVGILTKNSPEKSNALHMPRVPSLGLNIDRCIIYRWTKILLTGPKSFRGFRKTGPKALICSFMLWADEKGEFISLCKWIMFARFARTSWACKLLPLFCEEKLWKKTLYSGIKLIWEFPKQCSIMTKTCFW